MTSVADNSNRAKLKAAHEEERIALWHDHFKELLGERTHVSNKDISTIVFYLYINDKVLNINTEILFCEYSNV